MSTQKKGKLIMRVAWTETLRAMNVGETVKAELVNRINIVRHISRLNKLENKKFATKKISNDKFVIIRID